MSFYNTGNPVPSSDPRDLDDNAKNLDEFVNGTEPTYTDRMGVARKTLSAIESDADSELLRTELANFTDPLRGSALVGRKRSSIVKKTQTAAGMLDTLPLNVWEDMPAGTVYAPTTDPATWPDISAALTAAVAKLSLTPIGGTFEIPHGNYRCNDAFPNFPRNVIVKCNHSTIYFYGTGLFFGMDAGIGAGGGFENCIIRGTGASDQDGAYFQGSMPSCKKLYIQDFGGTSLRLGNVSVAGTQWMDSNQIHIWNQSGQPGGVTGNIGLLVDGAASGLNPNSNLNVLDNIMISGGFNTNWVIDRGVDNDYRKLNIAFRNATGKTLIRLEGSGTEIKSYIESADGTLPNKVVNMTSTSSRIYSPRNDFVISPGVGRSMGDFITDDGYANEFNVVPRGKDASGTGGNNTPSLNLFANSQFQVWKSATTPEGGRSASATITKGPTGYTGGRSVQFNDVASNSSLSFDITPSATSIINISLDYLKGKTITVGAWIKSTYPGPMLKIFAGTGNTASSGEHNGNGIPQFLCATLRVDAAATSVFAQLRSNNAGGGVNTGTANFDGMVFVFGSEIPKNAIPPIPSIGGAITGDLRFKYDAATFADSALTEHGGFYHWADSTGRSRKSATRPTARDSGESTLYPVIVGPLECSGPLKVGQYTLSTLPSAAANSGALIVVTDATGGPKYCRSNATVWQIINTTTTVS